MNIEGKHYRTVWFKKDDSHVVQTIDQRFLPFKLVIEDLQTVDDVATCIKDMHIRGAGLIGATAGYGMYLAALHAPRHTEKAFLESVMADSQKLKATRPTAVNLEWGVDRQIAAMQAFSNVDAKIEAAREMAGTIADEDADFCRRIGEHGSKIIEEISRRKDGQTVNILTHCNAGWLAFVDYGTATAPIYAAHDHGIKVHVWVDETRPRSQGARLTAWELNQHGVPNTLIVDNTSGYLMQHGKVDLVITGSDRTTYTGDVANKIGTYLVALAARDNNVPFYVALPSSTFDWKMKDGIQEIPVEERDASEVKYVEGWVDGQIKKVLITNEYGKAANYGFDVTPARLVTGLITERGVCRASPEGIFSLFPERRA